MAYDVAEDKRKAILLSGCTVATYHLIKNLASPEKPTDKTFAQLVQLLGEHHNPTMESADRNAKDPQKPQAVHVLKNQLPSRVPGRSSHTVKCYHCGGAHLATDCHFKDSEC